MSIKRGSAVYCTSCAAIYIVRNARNIPSAAGRPHKRTSVCHEGAASMDNLRGCTKQCSRETVLSIKVSLSLSHLKTRGIGGFSNKSRGQAIQSSRDRGATRDQPKYYDVLQREAGEKSECKVSANRP